MPGKSRHERGKHSVQSSKRRSKPSRPPTLAQQSAVAQAGIPVPSPNVSIPSVSVPTRTARPVIIRNPYITSELRTIGILGGILLIALVVLALLLP